MRQVVVVGAGISGLAAAWELTRPGAPECSVVVLERSHRLGGVLECRPFAGQLVDTGPDAFLGRRPEALALCRQLGLDAALVPVAGRGAGVWARGRVRPLPEALALGIPTRWAPVARSGILSPGASLALARDALLPRPNRRGPIADRAIGPLVARKLGRQVVTNLVDPLVGGIHAGSVDDMSAAATFPPLLAAARRRGSLMRALRGEMPPPPEHPGPLFWTLEGAMGSLGAHLGRALAARGVTLRCGAEAEALERRPGGWRVHTGAGPIDADGVVLALPAPAAGRLIGPHDDEAAGLLAAIAYASVALVTFSVPVHALDRPLVGTGFLVPRRSPGAPDPDGWAVTACTYLSEKWPHLAAEDHTLVRASVGRFGDDRASEWSDDELADRAWRELAVLMGLAHPRPEWMVARWPGSFPQYRVHHLLRTAGIEAAVGRLGGLAVAGSAYRGVGIPACIASGRAAAQALA